MNTINNKLVTPLDTSNILGVSEGSLAVWRSTKRYPLPYIKVGKKVMYRMSDINTFIESNTHTNQA